ncbi:3-methyl-2-oxobutanoate hydroxymethyltransferase [Fonsecaea pedrosoi CBS 271.37]|uniref:3-methyl-2-oxobutanoate hydroxymethyltransferase n=1 Tax=Fonsecaea pedrosoi CBS 271.37 TaxID=1442368 RepID=A0A0D2F5P4_9EURO|nr:3-methyl-2-oxobutanoate hydroxymethyltransferase [Fonsecaea pedrosoi CBS 271.37]KIW81997.1 3-methyl-2-oxobutanoate hydroxymethyltransferase [Fonsecaea pedrosoi CBS 271.37]
MRLDVRAQSELATSMLTPLGSPTEYLTGVRKDSHLAWDYPTALLCEKAGIDLVLVGDSLTIVALGHDATNYATLDEMIYHCKAVARGAKSPLLLGDMPMGSYEISDEQEGRCDAIKLEGGADMASRVRAIVKAGVPVIGHIGLTPQTNTSGASADGITAEESENTLKDALALQDAGAFAVVLETVAGPAAEWITSNLKIPTIGIGCGPNTSAQIGVQSELLGYENSLCAAM